LFFFGFGLIVNFCISSVGIYLDNRTFVNYTFSTKILKQGTENREQGTGNREQPKGNGE